MAWPNILMWVSKDYLFLTCDLQAAFVILLYFYGENLLSIGLFSKLKKRKRKKENYLVFCKAGDVKEE